MTVVSLDMAYRSFLEVLAGSHPPRYAASLKPSSPRFTHSSTLGAHGHSKDHRPNLKQMVLAVVLDGEGRPICTEMLPGNTADVTVLLPIVDRLRDRVAVGRVDADRQLRLPTLPAPGAQRGWTGPTRLRDRCRQAGRGSQVRRHLRAAHQRSPHPAAGGASLPRSAAGRGPVPPCQGDPAQPADLSFLRCRHPWPRLLLVPGADAAEGAG